MAKVLIIGDAALFLSDFLPLRKGFSLREKAEPLAVIAFRALSVPSPITAEQRCPPEIAIVRLRIIEVKMQSATLFPA